MNFLFKTCPHCQTPNIRWRRVCLRCGERLKEKADPDRRHIAWNGFRRSAKIKLTIEEDGETRKAVFPIDKKILIGRGIQCDVRLRSVRIGLLHAAIKYESGSMVIHDYSLNGLRVNDGHLICEGGSAALQNGDVITLAPCKIKIEYKVPA